MNMNDDIKAACAAWIAAKQVERQAMEERRAIEDWLSQQLELPEDLDGARLFKGDYFVRVAGRINYKIDSERLQEIAAEHGISDHLGTLFRWNPEIAMKAWKSADESITRPLSGAIVATPGRPSYSIMIKE